MSILGVVCAAACAWSCASAGPLRFTGSRFGVRADVDVDLATRVASVRLSGLPLGGVVSGTATLNDAGDPVMDQSLRSALERRGVRVEAVDMDPGLRSCRIVALLPFSRRMSITLVDYDGA